MVFRLFNVYVGIQVTDDENVKKNGRKQLRWKKSIN